MLFKDFLMFFDLDKTNIVICDNCFDEMKFYCSTDDDVEDLFLYDTFRVLGAYIGMHLYRYSVFIPCLFVSLEVFFNQ